MFQCSELYLWLSVLILFVNLSVTNTNHVSPCGQINRTGTSGTITSPNYPKPFPNQIECEWNIHSPLKALLKIEILDLDLDLEEQCLEPHCCAQHWLSVPCEGGRGSITLCGRKAPLNPITVMQPFTTIKYFSSELKKQGRGFTLHYTIDQLTCKTFEVQCNTGGCVSNVSRCNGLKDCPDGSDEVGCPLSLQGVWCTDGSIPCPSALKRCFSPHFQACDGDFACPRGEDELSCAPGCPNQIACASGEGCYDPVERCNGIRNCRDNSDETDCESACAPLQFICPRGGCVAASALCDGVDDCGDMSDEEHCAKSFLLTAATLGLLACIILACVGICWLYRFYTARLRASAAVFLHELEESEALDDDFIYREPPPSYAVAVAQSRTMPLVEIPDSVPLVHHSHSRRSRRRRSRHSERRCNLTPPTVPFDKCLASSHPQHTGVALEQQWDISCSSPSLSPGRESLTSSTSVEDLLVLCQAPNLS